MSDEILVSVTSTYTRVAEIAAGVLQGLYIERSAQPGLTGNIYLGKVVRVLRGTQSAFVDIGENRTGFIHVTDVHAVVGGLQQSTAEGDIGVALRAGQRLLVQVVREPQGDKGARLTTRVSLSSRYLVYLPRSTHIGISRQIKSNDERSRLRSQLDTAVSAGGVQANVGYILRSAADGASAAALQADLTLLQNGWQGVETQLGRGTIPARLYQVPPLYQRVIRDLVRPGLRRICVDDREVAAQLESSLADYLRELAIPVAVYDDLQALFDRYGVDAEVEKALAPRVDLGSGAYLIIEQTEAMTTVDVNTGSNVGSLDEEDTHLQVNLEAAAALARQLRLRNLGGIIVVDFIDMQKAAHKQQLVQSLEQAIGDDVPVSISAVSPLGLVEISRERSGESLANLFCEPCAGCGGLGLVKSVEVICYEVMRKILRDAGTRETDTLRVLAAQEVIDRLLGEDAGSVAGLERSLGTVIQFDVEPSYGREQFETIWL